MIQILRDPIWQGLGVLIALMVGFIGFYYAQKHKIWLYLAGITIVLISGIWMGVSIQLGRDQSTRNIALEDLASSVSAYTSVSTGIGAWKEKLDSGDEDFVGVFSLVAATPKDVGYKLEYSFPDRMIQPHYVGLSILIGKEQDLSSYSSMNLIVDAENDERFNIIIRDIAHQQDSYSINGTGHNQVISIPIKEYSKTVNLKVVDGVFLVSDANLHSPRGRHSIIISRVIFVR